MPETPTGPRGMSRAKIQILMHSLIDFLIDLLLPTAIYLALAPTGFSAVIRLTIGGFFVAAKAGAGRIAGPEQPEAKTSTKRALATGILLALACSAVTAGCAWIGKPDGVAIVAGTALLVIVQGAIFVRTQRKLDGFALLVLTEVIATIVLTLISNDPRFVLMRPSFYTAIAGVYVLLTTGAAQPFMMQVTRPMAADGDPVRAAAFDRAGRESPRFRRIEQIMTAGLGLVLIGEAVLRIVVILSRPAADLASSSVLSQLPGAALFLAYMGFVLLVLVPRARKEVDGFMPGGGTGAAAG